MCKIYLQNKFSTTGSARIRKVDAVKTLKTLKPCLKQLHCSSFRTSIGHIQDWSAPYPPAPAPPAFALHLLQLLHLLCHLLFCLFPLLQLPGFSSPSHALPAQSPSPPYSVFPLSPCPTVLLPNPLFFQFLFTLYSLDHVEY